jgi:hypothetical protein
MKLRLSSSKDEAAAIRRDSDAWHGLLRSATSIRERSHGSATGKQADHAARDGKKAHCISKTESPDNGKAPTREDGHPTTKSLGALSSVPLEVLHFTLVFLRRTTTLECAEISPFTGVRIFLPRIQPISARFESLDHDDLLASNLGHD